MAWSVNTAEVLTFWASNPKPAQDDERLAGLLNILRLMLNTSFSKLDDRLTVEPELQSILDYVCSMAVQRVWYSDPQGRVVSESQGPFSKSLTIDEGRSGLFFTESELQMLKEPEEPNAGNVLKTAELRPNFNIATNSSLDDAILLSSRYGRRWNW